MDTDERHSRMAPLLDMLRNRIVLGDGALGTPLLRFELTVELSRLSGLKSRRFGMFDEKTPRAVVS